jgi:dipeptidyl aminopeptidase/acylaminoacyl peptidase
VLSAGIPWDVEDFDVADDGQTLVLSANEDGISRLHVLDARSGSEKPAPQIPAGVIDTLRFQPGTRRFGFTLASARSPADAYAFDLDTWSLSRWTTSETAGFDTATFVEPALVRYKSFDEREIPAFVYRPDPARFPGKRPVIITIHGGPEGQYRPAFLGRANSLLNELGVVLVYPNVRGSSGYGKTYLGLDNGRRREDAVRDIGALLDWIGTQPDLDPARVGVIGGSYGGFMSLAVQTTYNARLRAGIDIVGISNFVTFLEHTQEYRRDLRRAEYGDERDPEMRSFLERVSPLANAEKIKTPILVVQGQNDPRVPLTEAEQIVAAVKRNKTPVWYVIGKNEGHGFAKKPNQDYLQAVEVLFWKRYLVDREP